MWPLPDHFPGFRFETIVGDRGWGAAVSRDDAGRSPSEARISFSPMEMTFRPFLRTTCLSWRQRHGAQQGSDQSLALSAAGAGRSHDVSRNDRPGRAGIRRAVRSKKLSRGPHIRHFDGEREAEPPWGLPEFIAVLPDTYSRAGRLRRSAAAGLPPRSRGGLRGRRLRPRRGAAARASSASNST